MKENGEIYQATDKVLSDFHMIKLHSLSTAFFLQREIDERKVAD